ncbi:hypothetical protein P8452_56361 [Trifolium repens]|nr:hypothetical protein P8452_56361 [Trifolium repens]
MVQRVMIHSSLSTLKLQIHSLISPSFNPLLKFVQASASIFIIQVLLPSIKFQIRFSLRFILQLCSTFNQASKSRYVYLIKKTSSTCRNRQSVYQSYHSIQSEHMHSHVCFPAMLETTAAVHPGASGGVVLKRLHTRQFKYSFCLIGHMIEHLIFLYSLVV